MTVNQTELYVPVDLSSHPAVISEAFAILHADVIELMPALALLAIETQIWQRAMEKLIEGFMLGIRDPFQLAEHGKLIFPTSLNSTAH